MDDLHTPSWIIREAAKEYAQHIDAMAWMTPRIKRVRRRGFNAAIRRGSIVQYAGETWEVIRRSAWTLWLAKYAPPMRVGDTIRVKLPKRFTA